MHLHSKPSQQSDKAHNLCSACSCRQTFQGTGRQSRGLIQGSESEQERGQTEVVNMMERRSGDESPPYTAREAARDAHEGACFVAWPVDEKWVVPSVCLNVGPYRDRRESAEVHDGK